MQRSTTRWHTGEESQIHIALYDDGVRVYEGNLLGQFQSSSEADRLVCRHLIVWVLLLFFPAKALAHTDLEFAYSDTSPPYSVAVNEEAAGLLPDIVELVFSFIPEYEAEHVAFPWARAQYNVENGRSDGLLTYPSDDRKKYALFTADPLYLQNYGNLVYDKDSAAAKVISSATGFDDLAELTVIVERGSSWEEENIPGYLQRIDGQDIVAKMHLLFRRGAGDFIVMPPEHARYMAQQLGYLDALRMQEVGFISESPIPFHLGVSRQNPHADEIIELVESVMANPDFQSQLLELIRQYR
ncbi:transporter substrate-binding domain-containing protein [Marinobacter sp. CHS3-4]|uniref:substrate-binding periplasmic protein n=1 Tax=Marinobacter sp. CHS3-4 TaxID=3045174 RepID=UPI0024B4A032|nr:transporter substrate-binding domain-containing protein [Marinobacter sp. CHS3-4]MDI9243859.1 transporter substrate-binding domain-containing protein [Marinobacter sp. CHS3-4]